MDTPKVTRRDSRTASTARAVSPLVNSYLVKFINVGRHKLTWEERIKRPITEHAIVGAVKHQRALMSRDVEAPYVDDWGGRIYAGVREVGSYVILPGSGE